ncbi:C4-dicarboxylate transporter DcuC [Campylobacter sputorum]|uniref:C4-dicarboxylate transporter DcuC n=1 Tax=Campylobacter sputorum TaxID=206 RepID=UPI000B78E17A|nr:C4-dicarboxylate transporter DcuC [Campylobacter sputorum]ASM37446.1 putative C4-dicarboxylate transporter, DcuC family [Campylobacter sputorum bv. faecalis CCUG 20703]
MESLKLFLSLVGIFAVVFLLIKKRDTKTVLIGVGLILCVICLQPMSAFAAFTKSMTNANLIKAICASMGFAYVMKVTKCDQHLVAVLTKPIKNLGFFLIPLATILTYFINIAIPSAAGCSAAVGATLIPLLMASGVRPSMAAASVLAGTFGSVLSPGASHNIYVTDLVVKSGNAAYTVQDVIKVQMPNAFASLVIVAICISLMAIILKDYDKTKDYTIKTNGKEEVINKANPLYALMPIIPLAILVIGGTGLSDTQFLKWTKMGVAEAMILGAIISIFATWTDPQKITKEFFNGMGSAYAEIMGIIIAAGVFVAGLKACGAIDWVIEFLKHEQTYVKFGGTFIPFIMGVVTGSGDAATMAFNTAITVHAADLGFAQDKLGMAAEIAGSLGRSASPIAGACIVCAGIAMANPVELAKRTFLGMFISTVVIAFFIL